MKELTIPEYTTLLNEFEVKLDKLEPMSLDRKKLLLDLIDNYQPPPDESRREMCAIFGEKYQTELDQVKIDCRNDEKYTLHIID